MSVYTEFYNKNYHAYNEYIHKNIWEGLNIIINHVPIVQYFKDAIKSGKMLKIAGDSEHDYYYKCSDSNLNIERNDNSLYTVIRTSDKKFLISIDSNLKFSKSYRDMGASIFDGWFYNKCLIRCLYEGSQIGNFVDNPLKFIIEVFEKENNIIRKSHIFKVYKVLYDMYNRSNVDPVKEFNMIILMHLLNIDTDFSKLEFTFSNDNQIITFCNLFGYHVVIHSEFSSNQYTTYVGNSSKMFDEIQYTIILDLFNDHFTLIDC